MFSEWLLGAMLWPYPQASQQQNLFGPSSSKRPHREAPSSCSVASSVSPGGDGSAQSNQCKPSYLTTDQAPIEQDEILVRAQKPRGSVRSETEPLRTLSPIDVRAFGAQSLRELLNALGNEVSSDRVDGQTQPVVLLNGRRLSSFDEIASYPPEAIERVEIYPEQLALELGFAANQKVVNLVTFKRFTQLNGQIDGLATTEGAGEQIGLSTQFLKIIDDTRLSGGLTVRKAAGISEADRGIIQPEGQAADAPLRSLSPKTRQVGVNLGYAGVLFKDTTFSLTGGWQSNDADLLLGQLSGTIIKQQTRNRAFNLGSSLSGGVGNWRWDNVTTYNNGRTVNTVSGAREPDSSAGRSSYVSQTLQNDLSLGRRVLRVPAGYLSTRLRVGLTQENIESRIGIEGADSSALSRRALEVFGSFSLPISTFDKPLPIDIGQVTFISAVGLRKISSRSLLQSWTASLTWKLSDNIQFFLSRERRAAAPSLIQLALPSLPIPNVRVFDFARGDSVDIVQLTGGNQTLKNEISSLFDVSTRVYPFKTKDIYISLAYSARTTREKILEFPILSTDLQRALPDRFMFDGSGDITAVDARPFNAAASTSKLLNLRLNWTRQIGKSSPENRIGVNPNPGGELPAGLVPEGSEIIYAPPGTALPPDLINALSRVFFSLNYTVRLEDTVRLSPQLPSLSLLDGFALNQFGGPPRHEVRITGGLFRQGLGASFNLNWRSDALTQSTLLRDSINGASVKFDYHPTLDVKAFLYPQDRVIGTVPGVFKGLQLSLGVNNLFNTRPSATDQSGNTPLRLQSAYRDPVGRSVVLYIRKVL